MQMYIKMQFSLQPLNFKMKFLLILLQISLINSYLNSNETRHGIKYTPNNYKSSNCTKYRRCILNSNINTFGDKIVNIFDKSSRYNNFRHKGRHHEASYINRNISKDLDYEASNYNRNISNGLLISHDAPEFHWDLYKSVYNKVYESARHEMAALAKWRNNLRRVAEHNKKYLEGKISYSLHLNHFGDLGATDYFKKILKLFDTIPLFDPAEDHHRTTYKKVVHRRTPREVDWRAKGFKPRLEEQFKCGACYAFAVAHALQAQVYRKHGDWRELSPQQIVDCSYKDGNMGCNGGSLRAALRYAAREGLVLESHYPYKGKKGRCHYIREAPRAKPRRWAMIPAGDEDGMERALATIGPLAVAINASPFTFQLYRSGIYDDPFCVPWTLNHAMLLVGYTPEYWILLNWWGKQWGENGYMRIRRGFNRCGVANMAAYVEL
ncbi:cathepsin S-like [Achroia grisella]|uniref:cathepsin S-like n=1 Tax=Achroia grisella TaxID=688607 RepID=UPI0027D2CF42|nr:cathepsin S-like [Achroia grisella]